MPHGLVSLHSNENWLDESSRDIPHACFFGSRIAGIEKPISLDINAHDAYVSRTVSEDKIGAPDQEANSHGSQSELREVCNANDRQWDTRLSGSLLNLFLLPEDWNGHSIFTVAKTQDGRYEQLHVGSRNRLDKAKLPADAFVPYQRAGNGKCDSYWKEEMWNFRCLQHYVDVLQCRYESILVEYIHLDLWDTRWEVGYIRARTVEDSDVCVRSNERRYNSRTE